MSYKSWMPFYVGDFLADVSGLTATEVGAYTLLILAYWSNGGPIPNDKDWIRRVLRHPKRFESLLNRLSQYFEVKDTHWHHQRIDKELNKASIAHAKRVSAGSKAHAKLEQSTTQPEPQPESEKKESTPLSPPKGGIAVTKEFLDFWQAYPEKVGRKAAWRAWIKATDKPELAVVLGALERYKKSKPSDRAWCNPATWINQGRWGDIPANGKDHTGPPPGIDPIEWTIQNFTPEQREIYEKGRMQ